MSWFMHHPVLLALVGAGVAVGYGIGLTFWLLKQPAITAPIIGPRTVDQLNGALRSLEVNLSPETMDRLNAIFPGPGGPAPEAYAW